MNSLLFERSTGNIGPNVFARLQTTSLLTSFAPAPRFRFDGGERPSNITVGEGSRIPSSVRVFDDGDNEPKTSLWAHQAGVSAMALEQFDGRILISGGSDATIRLWDLEQCPNPSAAHTYRPVASISRASTSNTSPSAPHRFSITQLSFYPFDGTAFLSSSFDHTLKLWSTETASVSGTFNLSAKVYTHATSPIASHLLVACGTQHPAIRLVDLRSSSATHSLLSRGQLGGSAGATLALAWSPVHEHVLASGSVDGALRVWDIRKSNGLVALFDQEDTVGLGHADGQIRAWLPQLEGVDDEWEGEETQGVSETRLKKRKALDDAFRSLMGRQVTYT
ncbi:hypothetical protein N0V88_000863 [Collariella sp. IMI 366227]|nr:hypothetical protein N0V88_000863 [Collariella sp. IMI 366227]